MGCTQDNVGVKKVLAYCHLYTYIESSLLAGYYLGKPSYWQLWILPPGRTFLANLSSGNCIHLLAIACILNPPSWKSITITSIFPTGNCMHFEYSPLTVNCQALQSPSGNWIHWNWILPPGSQLPLQLSYWQLYVYRVFWILPPGRPLPLQPPSGQALAISTSLLGVECSVTSLLAGITTCLTVPSQT